MELRTDSSESFLLARLAMRAFDLDSIDSRRFLVVFSICRMHSDTFEMRDWISSLRNALIRPPYFEGFNWNSLHIGLLWNFVWYVQSRLVTLQLQYQLHFFWQYEHLNSIMCIIKLR